MEIVVCGQLKMELKLRRNKFGLEGLRFQNGRTTAFELVRLGEDFAKAQRRYSEALVRTVNAVAKLKQLTSGKYPENTNN